MRSTGADTFFEARTPYWGADASKNEQSADLAWQYASLVNVPDRLRPAIASELQALVRGDYPELMTWVNDYGADGATLVEQPDDIWTHRYTDVGETNVGGWWVVVPLWTTDEAPSDLSAEIDVSPNGVAKIHDVHVL